MIQFKTFLGEAWLDPETGSEKQRKHWNTSPSEAKIHASSTQDISENDTHTFHKINKGASEEGEGNDVVYYAKKKGSKRIDATLNGTEKGDSIHIDSMATHPDGEMKMHHFLHHIVTKHGKSIGSSHYSPGGKKVMERVGEMGGVDITHWKNHKKIQSSDPYSDTKDTPAYARTYVVAQPQIHHPVQTADFHTKLNEEGNPDYDHLHSKEMKSRNHIAAVKKYTKSSYALNNYLHTEPSTKDRHLEKRKADMDAVFDHKENHVGEEIHVHTGLNDSPHDIINKETERQGQKPRHVHLHLKGYTSTTDDEEVAHDFAEQDHNLHKHVLHLHVPPHHPVVSVEKHTVHPREREFILHRNSVVKLNTTPDVDEDGTHHWFGKVVGRHEE